jgi:crotonobetainyl-CoA:carnitine CoA-transferase CaiB-like acyl-CoA transferase
MAGPLEGFRVLDFAQMMQGPWAAQMLGDMGADVIKVEVPGVGERGRHSGHYSKGGQKLMFLAMNRNKRSLTLNLKAPEGISIALTLVATADVMIENFRPGVMDRLGLGYARIKEVNPRIIYGSATGYGAEGPYSKKKGQDLLAQALSGLLSLSGGPGEPPTPMGTFVADQHSASLLAYGIVLALLHRERSGTGQRVEVDLLSSSVDLQPQELAAFWNADAPIAKSPERGHVHLGGTYGVFRAQDGYLVLAEIPLKDLGAALGLPHLAEKYVDRGVAYQRRDELKAEIEPILATRPVAEWIREFEARDGWSAPVRTYDEVAANPQLEVNGMLQEFEHPASGRIRVTGIPVRMSGTPGSIRVPPPLVGEHSEAILTELGYSAQEISAFRRAGVI